MMPAAGERRPRRDDGVSGGTQATVEGHAFTVTLRYPARLAQKWLERYSGRRDRRANAKGDAFAHNDCAVLVLASGVALVTLRQGRRQQPSLRRRRQGHLRGRIGRRRGVRRHRSGYRQRRDRGGSALQRLRSGHHERRWAASEIYGGSNDGVIDALDGSEDFVDCGLLERSTAGGFEIDTVECENAIVSTPSLKRP